MATWDNESNQTKWLETKVEPNQNWTQRLKEKSSGELYEMVFPKETSVFRKRPKDISDLAWSNHLNSLIGIICEIK